MHTNKAVHQLQYQEQKNEKGINDLIAKISLSFASPST